MGFKDLFRPDQTVLNAHESRLIKLETRLDTLREEWVDFKDIIRKQADRVEKRAQRQRQRQPCGQDDDEGAPSANDRILALRRRQRGQNDRIRAEG